MSKAKEALTDITVTAPVARRDVVADAIREKRLKRVERAKAQGKLPEDYKPPTEIEQLTRQLYLASLALNKYQEKLEDGEALTPEEERLFLAHQDSVRKLETTLSALRAKRDMKKKTDPELALEMVRAGVSKEQVLSMYPGNNHVRKAVMGHQEES